MFYSTSTGGFYDESIHGSRKVSIIEPGWVHPEIEVPDPAWDADAHPDEIPPTIMIPDPTAIPVTIEICNLDCKIPSDAVEISSDEHAALLAGQSTGKLIAANAEGAPVLVDPPPVPFADIKRQLFTQVRAAREVALNRLAGIGFAAQAAGDMPTVNKVLTARTSLLNITSATSVATAVDEASLKAALVEEYTAIVTAAGAGLSAAFAEFSL